MKKALITGITGQDGSYLADLLFSKGYHVIGVKRRTSILASSHLARKSNLKISEWMLLGTSLVESYSQLKALSWKYSTTRQIDEDGLAEKSLVFTVVRTSCGYSGCITMHTSKVLISATQELYSQALSVEQTHWHIQKAIFANEPDKSSRLIGSAPADMARMCSHSDFTHVTSFL